MTFYIGIHARRVPEWLETVTPTQPDAVLADLKWVGLAVVTIRDGEFYVRPLFPQAYVMKLSAEARGLTICGQSPNGGPGLVNLHMASVIPSWFVGVLAGIAASAAFLALRS